MDVVIGIDPHTASHTAVALDASERSMASVRVRASAGQLEQLLSWSTPFPAPAVGHRGLPAASCTRSRASSASASSRGPPDHLRVPATIAGHGIRLAFETDEPAVVAELGHPAEPRLRRRPVCPPVRRARRTRGPPLSTSCRRAAAPSASSTVPSTVRDRRRQGSPVFRGSSTSTRHTPSRRPGAAVSSATSACSAASATPERSRSSAEV